MPRPPKPGRFIAEIKDVAVFSENVHRIGAKKRRAELSKRLKKMPSLEAIRKQAERDLPRAQLAR